MLNSKKTYYKQYLIVKTYYKQCKMNINNNLPFKYHKYQAITNSVHSLWDSQAIMMAKCNGRGASVAHKRKSGSDINGNVVPLPCFLAAQIRNRDFCAKIVSLSLPSTVLQRVGRKRTFPEHSYCFVAFCKIHVFKIIWILLLTVWNCDFNGILLYNFNLLISSLICLLYVNWRYTIGLPQNLF